MTEPDAWKFTETLETIKGEVKESEQATLLHPESDEFQFYPTDSHEIEIEEPLFGLKTIQKLVEKAADEIAADDTTLYGDGAADLASKILESVEKKDGDSNRRE